MFKTVINRQYMVANKYFGKVELLFLLYDFHTRKSTPDHPHVKGTKVCETPKIKLIKLWSTLHLKNKMWCKWCTEYSKFISKIFLKDFLNFVTNIFSSDICYKLECSQTLMLSVVMALKFTFKVCSETVNQ